MDMKNPEVQAGSDLLAYVRDLVKHCAALHVQFEAQLQDAQDVHAGLSELLAGGTMADIRTALTGIGVDRADADALVRTMQLSLTETRVTLNAVAVRLKPLAPAAEYARHEATAAAAAAVKMMDVARQHRAGKFDPNR